MIERDDLRAAVAAGAVTEAQAARLIALAQERQGLRSRIGPSEEPFELFQGLNEIFIVVGMTILFGGWSALTGLSIFEFDGGSSLAASVYGVIGIIALTLCALYFTEKRRMVAPSIAIAIMLALTLVQFGFGLGSGLKLVFNQSLTLVSAITFLGLTVFWARFRVPFTLALIGLSGFSLLYAISLTQGAMIWDMQNAFLLSADGPFALITIAFGLILFAVALFFDLSDPHRVTRRAANGFWLHVVAAPAIVNTVALTLLELDSTLGNLTLLAFLLLIALIAIVIDRRSFLMAGAGYAVALSIIVLDGGSPLIILLLGALLVFLGAKWEAIRASILNTLPGFPGKTRLPPWATKDATEN